MPWPWLVWWWLFGQAQAEPIYFRAYFRRSDGVCITHLYDGPWFDGIGSVPVARLEQLVPDAWLRAQGLTAELYDHRGRIYRRWGAPPNCTWPGVAWPNV